MLMKDKLRKFFETIFPDKYSCNICGKELENSARLGLCEECIKDIHFVGDERCTMCGVRIEGHKDICDSCRRYPREFSYARSAVVFEDNARILIHKLKFNSERYIAKYLSAFLVDVFVDEKINCDIVTCVPLSKKRRRARGYNQAEEIAKYFCERLELDCDMSILVKVKEIEPFAKSTASERIEMVSGAYEAVKPELIQDKTVLLIDDVLTTGSTTSEVSKTLVEAGAKEVIVLTFASTALSSNKPDEIDEETE